MSSRASRWPEGARRLGEVLRDGGAGLSMLVALMDTAWIIPYALLLGAAWRRPGAPLLAPFAVWSLVLAGQIAARWALGRRPGAARLDLLVGAAGTAAALLAVAAQYGGDPWWRAVDAAFVGLRPELPAFVLGILLWRRGIGVGRTPLEYYDVEGVFYLGLAAAGVFAAGAALGKAEPAIAATAGAALPYLVLFFASSLVALPVARIGSIRRQTQAGPQSVAIGRDWYGLIAAAVVAVLGVAFAAAAVLRLNLAAALGAAGRIFEPVLWALLYVVAVPLGYLVGALVWVVQRLLHPHSAPRPPRPFAPPAWLQAAPHQAAGGLSPAAAAALRWGAAALIVILLVWWLARGLFRYDRLGRPVAADETRESVWSWADLRAALAAWLRLPRRAARGDAGPDFGAGSSAAVRRAYAELLGLAAAAGTPRPLHLTPDEFSRRFGAARPRTARDIRRLTAVYDRVRYGGAEPSDAELATVSEALTEIHRTLEEPEGRQAR